MTLDIFTQMTETELLTHFKKSVELNLRPRFLYQYRPINKYFFSSIENSQIFFRNPLDFNDPFECRFSQITITQRDWITHVKYLKSNGLYDKFVENSDSNRDPREEMISKFFESLKAMGVSCFTTKNNNGLMWSHYANSHKGLCLEFDTLADVTLFKELYKVKYVNNRWAYNYLRNPLKVYEFFSRKSNIWKYEEEYRVIKIEKGLHAFNKNSLKKVIFGCRTSKQNRTIVLKRLAKYGYECEAFYVNPSSINYELEIVPL